MGAHRNVRWKTALGVVAIVGCLVFVTLRLTGFPSVTDFSALTSNGVTPDSIHERAVGWEAIWGDAHRSLDEILPEHGYEEGATGISPRPPSALLLQTSLLLIPERALMPAVSLIVVVLLMWIGWLARAISGLEVTRFLIGASILLLSLPVLTSLAYSPVFALLAVALLLAAWRYQDRPWAGFLLGMSAALRLWPGLVILGFWLAGRRRLARDAALTFFGLNLVGLMLPGVSFAGSITSLLSAKDTWLNHNMNSSLALVLWPFGVPPVVSLLAVCALGTWLAVRNRAYAVPITILAALLASPLSWPAYGLAALPIGALYARFKSPKTMLLIAGWLACWSLWPSHWLGHVHFVVLVAMLALFARPRPLDLTDSASPQGGSAGARDLATTVGRPTHQVGV